MKLCNMAYQEPDCLTMDHMSVRSVRRWKYDRLCSMSDSKSGYIDTLDEMSNTGFKLLESLLFYSRKQCGYAYIVKSVSKKYGKIMVPSEIRTLIHWHGFLYALSGVQSLLEHEGEATMTLRELTTKGCEHNDY